MKNVQNKLNSFRNQEFRTEKVKEKVNEQPKTTKIKPGETLKTKKNSLRIKLTNDDSISSLQKLKKCLIFRVNRIEFTVNRIDHTESSYHPSRSIGYSIGITGKTVDLNGCFKRLKSIV